VSNSEVVRRLLDALDAGDFDSALDLLAPDFSTTPVSTGVPIGKDEWFRMHKALHENFPTLRRNPSDFREEGDTVVVTLHVTAVNDRPVRLPQLGIDELPATGIEIVSPPNVDTFTLRDGKVTSVSSDMPPGGGFKGMIEQIRAAAEAR
jgi:ketosteroid isomerase-like protein